MRPKPPRSLSARHHADEWYIAVVMSIVASVWEAGWLVLSLAGANPQGQLPQAFGRVMSAVHLAVANHAISGGWAHVLFDPARPVSPVAVVLVVVGLLLAATMAVRTARRLLGLSARGGGIRWPRSGGGTAAAVQPTSATVDKSLDAWLAEVAAGEDE
jgi:hypothetical protein